MTIELSPDHKAISEHAREIIQARIAHAAVKKCEEITIATPPKLDSSKEHSAAA